MRLIRAILVSSSFLGLTVLSFAGSKNIEKIVPDFEVLVSQASSVPVYYFTSNKIPLFEVHFVFSNGSETDPNGKSGLSLFAASLIRKGTAQLDENAISEKLDDLAADFEISVDESKSILKISGLLSEAPAILDLFETLLKNPTYPKEPFKRIKYMHLQNIAASADNPGVLASHVLNLVLQNNSSKARPTSGFLSDVKNLKIEDLKSFYHELFRKDRLKVLVIGGKDRAVIADRVLSIIESLPCKLCGKPKQKVRNYTFPKWKIPKNHVLLVDRPGIPEVHIRAGFLGPKRNHPDYCALKVAEAVLSSSSSSRLNAVLREKLNLTYAADAGFYFGEDQGVFNLSTSTHFEKAPLMLKKIKEILSSFAFGKNLKPSELDLAKGYINGSFAIALQNVFSIASTAFYGTMMGLSPKYLNEYRKKITRTNLNDVNRALKKHMKINELQTVIVGDKKKIAPLFRKSGISFITRSPKDFF